MRLLNILLQTPLPTDTVAASRLHSAANGIKSHADSLSHHITNTDSLAALTPAKIANGFRNFDWNGLMSTISTHAVSLMLRILAAVVIFYLGKFIINKTCAIARAMMIKRDFDRSLTSFLLSLIRFTLLFVLIIIVISVVGIETSSFIALFASAGVAIGMALSGTLQNFAGGVLILLIKPYKVGDYIEFGNFKGVVKELQIFHTIITTPNNDSITIPNGGLSTGIINNFSSEPYHRAEWRVSISYGDDVSAARSAILSIFDADSRIVKHEIADTEPSPAPEAEVDTEVEPDTAKPWWKHIFHRSRKKATEWRAQHEAMIQAKLPKKDFTPTVAVESLADSSVVLVARAWCQTSEYWRVVYDTNEKIYNVLPKHGIHFPFPQLDVNVHSSAAQATN